MITETQVSLTVLLTQIDNTPDPIEDNCTIEDFPEQIKVCESHLAHLKNIKSYLLNTDALGFKDTVELMKRVKRIYEIFTIFETIKDYYKQTLLNTSDNINTDIQCSQLLEDLLINRTIIIVNRKLFEVTKKFNDYKRKQKVSK